jgi:DNA-binding response OmpR family regulator
VGVYAHSPGFFVLIPASSPGLTFACSVRGGIMTTEVDKSRVLVVDDEPTVADVLRDLLVAEGYHVRTAAEGRNALASFDAWRPRLVITDLSMAPMNGIELCRHIRAGSNVPIIVVSGEDGEECKIDALDSGADDYVVKPFNAGELLARIRAVLRRGPGTASDSGGSIDAGDFLGGLGSEAFTPS